jgi:inosine-uridine nucleoside N-ribohydrolase
MKLLIDTDAAWDDVIAGDLVSCAIGPLTNLAVALSLDPDLPRLVRQVHFMGGSYHSHGDISPVALLRGGQSHAAQVLSNAPGTAR